MIHIEKMDPPWSDEHASAAVREGWAIWECSGSNYGKWQVQRVDEVEPMLDGFMPPQLTSDTEAWLRVNTGTGEHHSAARAFIAAHNPEHFAEIRRVG